MNSKNFLILALCTMHLACSRGDIEIYEQSNMSKKDFEGSWIVLNYWADWCPPCIKEIPELSNFAANNPNVYVLGYNFDKLTGEELANQLKIFKHNYPALLSNPFDIWGIEPPSTLPATYFISSEGDVLFESRKPIDEKSISELLESLQETF